MYKNSCAVWRDGIQYICNSCGTTFIKKSKRKREETRKEKGETIFDMNTHPNYCYNCIYLFYEEEESLAINFNERYHSHGYTYKCEFFGVRLDCNSHDPVRLKKCIEENRFLEEEGSISENKLISENKFSESEEKKSWVA